MSSAYPKEVTLRDGRKVTLRPLESQDEEQLIRFFAELPQSDTQFLKHDVSDPDVVRGFVRRPDLDRVWPIIALSDEGQIMGDATLHTPQHGWRRHVGEIRVVVAPEFQKSRLATTLIHELVNHATMLHIKKLVAQMLDSQVGARQAFERLGFRTEATLKDNAMDLKGRLHDVVILTHTVEDLWAKMEDMFHDMDFSRDTY